MMASLPDLAKGWIDDHEFATIATILPDGQPHLSVVWIERDGDTIIRHDDEPGSTAWQRTVMRVLSWLPIESQL